MRLGAADSCVAAEIGNFRFFALHPSASPARIKCTSCERTLMFHDLEDDFLQPFEARLTILEPGTVEAVDESERTVFSRSFW